MTLYKKGDKIRALRDGEQHCIKFGAVCTVLADMRSYNHMVEVEGPSARRDGTTKQFLFWDQMKPAKQANR